MNNRNLLLSRKVVAACIFAAFLLLFAVNVELPFLAHLAMIQPGPALFAGSFIILAALAIFSLLFGCLYCSLLCPLGLLQDLLLHLRRKRPFKFRPVNNKFRLAILLVFVVFLLSGSALLASILDPYSTFGRAASALLAPLAASGQNFLGWSGDLTGVFAIPAATYNFPGWPAMFAALAALLLLLAATFTLGRVWCDYCPAGSILGFLSRKSFFRMRLDSGKCVHCRKCEKACKIGCIVVEKKMIDPTRCVSCFNYASVCAKKALEYGPEHVAPAAFDRDSISAQPQDTAKRTFLQSLPVMALATSLLPTHAESAEIEKNQQARCCASTQALAQAGIATDSARIFRHCAFS